jgi:hypothetical protein
VLDASPLNPLFSHAGGAASDRTTRDSDDAGAASAMSAAPGDPVSMRKNRLFDRSDDESAAYSPRVSLPFRDMSTAVPAFSHGQPVGALATSRDAPGSGHYGSHVGSHLGSQYGSAGASAASSPLSRLGNAGRDRGMTRDDIAEAAGLPPDTNDAAVAYALMDRIEEQDREMQDREQQLLQLASQVGGGEGHVMGVCMEQAAWRQHMCVCMSLRGRRAGARQPRLTTPSPATSHVCAVPFQVALRDRAAAGFPDSRASDVCLNCPALFLHLPPGRVPRPRQKRQRVPGQQRRDRERRVV